MTEIFVNGDFEDKYNQLPLNIQKSIDKVLNNLPSNLNSLRRLPRTKLYIKKMNKYVLIFSKGETSILAMDIMTLKEFHKEIEKTSLLFF